MGYILGLGGPYYHDASACLVGPDGTILAFVEEERLDAKQFRAFTFENAARFYTDTNPRFFEGTAIESDVAKFLTTRSTRSTQSARNTRS